MKAIDFFSGIGGLSLAFADRGEVIAAYDQNLTACRVYAHNLHLRPAPRHITGVTAGELARLGADMWLLSPPCQPFTHRGRRRDLADPRNSGLLHLVGLLPRVRPRGLLLENVMGFARSATRTVLLEALRASGYTVVERSLCPTDLGIPNRRPRHYVLAGLLPLCAEVGYRSYPGPLARYLDPAPDPDLAVDETTIAPFRAAMSVVAPDGVAACFARSYGRMVVRSGSYLATSSGLRRFSPEEIARLLHFPGRFEFPADVRRLDRYRLLGNSVNVAVVQELLRHFEREG